MLANLQSLLGKKKVQDLVRLKEIICDFLLQDRSSPLVFILMPDNKPTSSVKLLMVKNLSKVKNLIL